MDIFEALEERVDALISAYRELHTKVASLEEENQSLRGGGDEVERLKARVGELESERDEVRARLEKVVKTLSALDV